MIYQRGQDIYTTSVSTRWIWLVWVTPVYMYTLGNDIINTELPRVCGELLTPMVEIPG